LRPDFRLSSRHPPPNLDLIAEGQTLASMKAAEARHAMLERRFGLKPPAWLA
jgi:hypothetical protein